MDDKCKGSFGSWRCNFEPRYDDIPTDPELVRYLVTLPNATNVNVGTQQRYVCDVCTACGDTRQRPTENR